MDIAAADGDSDPSGVNLARRLVLPGRHALSAGLSDDASVCGSSRLLLSAEGAGDAACGGWIVPGVSGRLLRACSASRARYAHSLRRALSSRFAVRPRSGRRSSGGAVSAAGRRCRAFRVPLRRSAAGILLTRPLSSRSSRPSAGIDRSLRQRGSPPVAAHIQMRRGIRSTQSANTDCFCARLRSGSTADDGVGTERRRLPVMTLQRLLRAERRLDRFGRGRDAPGDAHPLNALLAGTGGRDGDVPSLWRDAAAGAGVQLSLAHREGASARQLCADPGGTYAPFAAGGADVQSIRQ